MNEFEELTRIYELIALTVNDADRITLDEKYTLLKDKYNRLLDNLTQRVALLDEASRKFECTKRKFELFGILNQVNELNLMNRMIVFKNSTDKFKAN